MAVHVFCGPTISGGEVNEILPSAHIHDPIKHGDLIRINPSQSDQVIIIDGLYHNHPTIRHKELLAVIEGGATIIGASSMGALRAAELHPFGMIGIGRVFEMYRDGVIEADDEVAVVHTHDTEWRVLSDALVNIRHTLALAVSENSCTPKEADSLLRIAIALPYARRSWRAIARQAAETADLHAAAKRIWSLCEREPNRCNLKRLDALRALEQVHSHLGGVPGSLPTMLAQQWPEGWQTGYLFQWRQDHTGTSTGDRFISRALQFDYERLYAQDFSARWRVYVLGVIAQQQGCELAGDPEIAALAHARRQRIDVSGLTAGQLAAWLTPDEQSSLSADEAMLQIMVRSARFAVDLTSDEVAQRLLAEDRSDDIARCLVLNDVVASSSYTKHIDHLKPYVLREHLAQLWGLAPGADEATVTAAARDRGFSSASGAAEAARPFFLDWYNACRVAAKETA